MQGMTGWQPLPESVFALAAAEPFSLLFHTARYSQENHQSRLFRRPVRRIQAFTQEEIPAAFALLERSLDEGLHVAGYFAYECGRHFEPTIGAGLPRTRDAQSAPLIWLGCYAEPLVFDHAATSQAGDEFAANGVEEDAKSETERWRLRISSAEYRCRIEAILEKIRAGESYQANFTDAVEFSVARHSAMALYRRLIRQQPVAYGAFLDLGERKILSFSPELFFRRDGERVVTRPMKGTMPRGVDSAEDEVQAQRLRKDPKNRAEHVMIVDLLRNDLGRIAEMGSVRVEDLFTVERYPTLLQMTSTISARVPEKLDFYAIFRALFPSGSITGAPKVHTMRILAGLEAHPRGVYCGAIGYFSPDRKAVFNVAIRTLEITGERATMGVGGGIVADSRADEEYGECLLKASFLSCRTPEFELIETMLWRDGVKLEELHLERLKASAQYFDFDCDTGKVRERIAEAGRGCRPGVGHRLRLLLNREGECRVEAHPLGDWQAHGRIALAAERVNSTDRFLRHKTTHRALYDRYRGLAAERGLDDVIFLNERGELTEGAISNLFVERDGWLLTPPLSAGVLPGVFRRQVLESRSEAREETLTPDDLQRAERIYLCNALRGMYPVRLVEERACSDDADGGPDPIHS